MTVRRKTLIYDPTGVRCLPHEELESGFSHPCPLAQQGVPVRVRGLSRTVGLQNIHSLGRPAHNESPNLHNLIISKSLMEREVIEDSPEAVEVSQRIAQVRNSCF
jgi:hypothetical protein